MHYDFCMQCGIIRLLNNTISVIDGTSFWKIIQVNTTYWYKFFVNNNTGTTSCNIINNTQKNNCYYEFPVFVPLV